MASSDSEWVLLVLYLVGFHRHRHFVSRLNNSREKERGGEGESVAAATTYDEFLFSLCVSSLLRSLITFCALRMH